MADVDDDKSSRESAEVSTTRWPLRLARAGQITKSEPQTTCYRPARDSGHGASSDAPPQRMRGRSSGAAVCGGTTARVGQVALDHSDDQPNKKNKEDGGSNPENALISSGRQSISSCYEDVGRAALSALIKLPDRRIA